MFLLKTVVLLIALLFLLGVFRVARILIPELDRWWTKSNKRDQEMETLADIKDEDRADAEKARTAKSLNKKKKDANRGTIEQTLKERRPS